MMLMVSMESVMKTINSYDYISYTIRYLNPVIKI